VRRGGPAARYQRHWSEALERGPGARPWSEALKGARHWSEVLERGTRATHWSEALERGTGARPWSEVLKGARHWSEAMERGTGARPWSEALKGARHWSEALLHAISKGATKLVKVIIEHPNYVAGEEQCKRTQKDPFFRTDEKSQFSPDITPLILAAHNNNHEIIQLFISINHTIDKPHPIACQCSDCVTKRNYDSLKRSMSRLHAYRALASPAYMALSSHDPIMTTFQLRQEMKQLAQVEKEFKVGLIICNHHHHHHHHHVSS